MQIGNSSKDNSYSIFHETPFFIRNFAQRKKTASDHEEAMKHKISLQIEQSNQYR